MGDGVGRDVGGQLFSSYYGGVGLEVGGEVDDIIISKYVKYEVDMKVYDSIGWYVDRDVYAEVD